MARLTPFTRAAAWHSTRLFGAGRDGDSRTGLAARHCLGQVRRSDRTRTFAHGSDAGVVLEFAAGQTSNRGRAANERPKLGRDAVMSVAGRNGLLEEGFIAYDTQGALSVDRHLGFIDARSSGQQGPARARRLPQAAGVPAASLLHREVSAGDHVEKGPRLARFRDLFGVLLAQICAPPRPDASS